jgi:hypothetical protein
MYHGTAVADLDNDGLPELVIGSYNDTLYCINGENGTTQWKYKASGGYIGGPACMADIDNDGSCDVVFVSSYKVTALSSTGAFKWNYNIPGFEQSFRGAALADINNDSLLDVVFGTNGGKLMALNGYNGTLIWTKDLAAHYGNSNFELDHAPLIADFDNDDSLDVFIVGGYGSYPNFQVDFGRAYMLTAGKGHGPDWLMFQRNIQRQSSLCSQSTVSVYEPGKPPTVSCFPNPCENSLTITGTAADASIVLCDVMGKELTTLRSSAGKSVIDTGKLSAGLYFISYRTEGKSSYIKFIKR